MNNSSTQESFSDKWNYRFMEIALHISSWSKDPNTKVGSVVVGPDKEIRSQGYNGFPRGVNDDVPERHVRPTKYAFYEHSERNAIYNAVKFGACLEGCTLYVTMPPCADCARAIIQSGIKHVCYLEPSADKARTLPNGNWRDTVVNSFEMFNEAGVKVTLLDRETAINGMESALNVVKPKQIQSETKKEPVQITPENQENILKEYQEQMDKMRGCFKTLAITFAAIVVLGVSAVVVIKRLYDKKQSQNQDNTTVIKNKETSLTQPQKTIAFNSIIRTR